MVSNSMEIHGKWQIEIMAGNDYFQLGQTLSALVLYRRAINLAQEFVLSQPNERNAWAALLVSHQNLADLYLSQNAIEMAERELVVVHQHFLSEVRQAMVDSQKCSCLLWGINKSYFALVALKKAYPESRVKPDELLPVWFQHKFATISQLPIKQEKL